METDRISHGGDDDDNIALPGDQQRRQRLVSPPSLLAPVAAGIVSGNGSGSQHGLRWTDDSGGRASGQQNIGAMLARAPLTLQVRFQIIGNARIENVGKSQSCMVSKLPIIWKQTVAVAASSRH